jgi:hypothetical protein
MNYYPSATDAVLCLTKILWSEKVQISNTIPQVGQSKSHCAIFWLHFLLRLNCHPDTIYYKLQNVEWPKHYSVHKIKPDIHMMCELHVTVKLYRVEGSLCDADSHFFTNRRNSCFLNFFFRTTAQQRRVTNVRLSEENGSRIFKENLC